MRTRLRFVFTCLIIGFIITACRGESPSTLAPASPTVSVISPTQPAPTATKPAILTSTDLPEPSATTTLALAETQAPPARPTPSLTPTPGMGSTALSPRTGSQLVFVPEGEFLMGSADDDPLSNTDETPQRLVFIDAFWIDQTEITNKMFAQFLNEESNQEEGGIPWFDASADVAQIDEAGYDYSPKPGLENYPVASVSWYGARAYCDWAGGRLPTEAEWEKAARGTEAYIYPWGNEKPDGDLLNSADISLASDQSSFEINDGFAYSAPAGSFPAGVSPYGALDMAGNVWEWVSDWYGKDAYSLTPNRNPIGVKQGALKIVRGGSWFDSPDLARSAYRGGFKPATYWPYVGFRCAFEELGVPPTTPTLTPASQTSFALVVKPDKQPYYEVVDIQETLDNGYVLVGNVSTSKTGEYAGKPVDLYAARLAPDGNEIWQYAFGDKDADLYDSGTAILPTLDGDILLAGFTKGKLINGKAAGAPWLLKLDLDGKIVWEVQLPGIKLTDWMDVVETKKGEYVVAGHEWGNNSSGIWLWRLKATGELRDTSKLALKEKGLTVPWSPYFDLARTHDQGFILLGAFQSRTGDKLQLGLVRFNQDGDIIWHQAYDQAIDIHQPVSVVHLRSGGFGLGFTNRGGDFDGPMLGKLDENGQPVWWVNFPYTLINISRVAAAGEGFAAAGWGVDGAWVGQVDGDGLITNQANYESDPSNSNVIDQFTSLDQTLDGGVILAGTNTLGGSGLSVLRLDGSLSSSFCDLLTPGSVGSVLIHDKLLSGDGGSIEYSLQQGELQNTSSAFWKPGDRYKRAACR